MPLISLASFSRSLFKVLQSDYLNEGDVTKTFEAKIAALTGARFAIATTSGTTAIFLALKALGIGTGDEVIVPDVTFIATANAVELTGATVRLVDVSPATLTMAPEAFRAAITSKTKAVIPVHVTGRPADMKAITEIADAKKIAVVEDAAECWSSFHRGKHLGTVGKLGCLSLSPNKTITTGQGGFVLTDDSELAVKLVALKDQGRAQRGTGGDDLHPTVGFNFKLTNLQAAVGVAQLGYLKKRVERLHRNLELYREALAPLSEIRLLPFDLKDGNTPQWVDALCDQRNELTNFLIKAQMGCRRFWHPLHRQAPYQQPDQAFPVSSQLCDKALWLPSAYTLTDADIARVCRKIGEFFGKTLNA